MSFHICFYHKCSLWTPKKSIIFPVFSFMKERVNKGCNDRRICNIFVQNMSTYYICSIQKSYIIISTSRRQNGNEAQKQRNNIRWGLMYLCFWNIITRSSCQIWTFLHQLLYKEQHYKHTAGGQRKPPFPKAPRHFVWLPRYALHPARNDVIELLLP